jgi:hypothetical protein
VAPADATGARGPFFSGRAGALLTFDERGGSADVPVFALSLLASIRRIDAENSATGGQRDEFHRLEEGDQAL